jgi:hypothetical protein
MVKESSFYSSKALERSSMGFAFYLKKRVNFRARSVSLINSPSFARLALIFSFARKPYRKQSSSSLREKYTVDPKGTLLKEFALMTETFLLIANG